jgi:hypothetical protein
MRYGEILLRMVRLAVTRPRTLVWLLATAWRLRARDWYRRPPFVPLPPRAYVAWRLHTAYGDEERVPEPAEIERYLGWAAWMRRVKQR